MNSILQTFQNFDNSEKLIFVLFVLLIVFVLLSIGSLILQRIGERKDENEFREHYNIKKEADKYRDTPNIFGL